MTEEEIEENKEDLDVETLDLELDDEGIDNLIKDLQELKKDKASLIIPVEEELQIIIHHADEPMGDEE